MPPRGSSTNRVQVLDEDGELTDALSPRDREDASEHCLAAVLSVPRGRWAASRMKVMSDGIGLLVLEGLLIRRVGIDGRFGAELLGEGDLLRPWQGEDIQTTLPHATGWRVVQPVRVAVLDGAVAARFARYPALTGVIAAKALNRARRLAANMAIVHHPRVEVRVHMLLWHLADRWGRVRPDGIIVPLRLTHSAIADLVAAQRPSVTSSLGKLIERNLIQPADEGWLLIGEPPVELLEVEELEPGARAQPRAN